MSTIWNEIIYELKNVEILIDVFFPNLITLILISLSFIFSIFIPGYLVLKIIEEKCNKKFRFKLNFIILFGFGIRTLYTIIMLLLNQNSIYSSILFIFINFILYLIYIQKRNGIKEYFKINGNYYIEKIRNSIVNSSDGKIILLISIYFILTIFGMGLLMRGPSGDDPVSHILFIQFISRQQTFLPKWEQISTYFLISEQITYPLVVHIFSSFDFVIINPFFTPNFFLNQQLRVLLFCLLISLISFTVNVKKDIKLSYFLISLIFLETEFIFLIKWSGFAFIFGLILGISYIVYDLQQKFDFNSTDEIISHKFKILIQLFFLAAMFLIHPVVMGILLLYHLSCMILSFKLYKFKKKTILSLKTDYFIDNFVVFAFLGLQLLYLFLKLVMMNQLHYLASISTLFSYLLTYTSIMPWNYMRIGQTGQITGVLIQTNLNILNSIQILFTVFNFVGIFSFLYILLKMIKMFQGKTNFIEISKNKNEMMFQRILVFCLVSSITLFLLNLPYLFGLFQIEFLFGFFLFRIHRSYSILIQLIYPLFSTCFLQDYLPKFNNYLIKNISRNKLKKNNLSTIPKIISLILVFSLGFSYTSFIMIRSTIYYDSESIKAFQFINDNIDPDKSVIMNDRYGNWLPVVSEYTITYSFSTGTNDMIYSAELTRNITMHLFEGNFSYSLSKIINYSITHIFFRYGSFNSSINILESLENSNIGEIIYSTEKTFIFEFNEYEILSDIASNNELNTTEIVFPFFFI